MKNRRDFLKQTSFICGGMLLAGGALSNQGCKIKAAANAATNATPLAVVDGKVKIPVADFTDLNSKVINVPSGPQLLINKNADGTYTAFEYKCTHAGGPLEKQGNELVCPWHDSRFGLDGSLKKGPAKKGLKGYPASIEDGNVVIKVA